MASPPALRTWDSRAVILARVSTAPEHSTSSWFDGDDAPDAHRLRARADARVRGAGAGHDAAAAAARCAWIDSQDCAPARALRHATTRTSMVLIEGV
jgi:hypothetical protein